MVSPATRSTTGRHSPPRAARHRRPLMATVAAALLPSLPAHAQSAAADSARIGRVEHGLLPAVAVAGDPDPPYTLAERMRRHRVPGVSVVVLDRGGIAWARAYGVTDARHPQPVDSATLFQAGSVSKAVTAVAAMRLVERGTLDLDTDVNRRLTTWRVPENHFTTREKVTLRRLLSHTAGLTVAGFSPGYRPGARLPTIAQILDGRPPATNPPVRVAAVPGSAWAYSGGGTTVVQQLLVDATGRPFPTLVRQLVLAPADMPHSTFEQPLGVARAAHAATGHSPGDTPLPGRWPVHPELAAAGLWSTAPDLARFAAELLRAARGAPSRLLGAAATRQMLTPTLGGWGLGVSLGSAPGDSATVGHDGSTAGYTCRLLVFPATAQGIVVMTNGESEALIDEIVRSVAREYRWPVRPRPVRRVAAITPAAAAPLAGRYRITLGARTIDVAVTVVGRRVFFTGTSGRPAEILPASPDEYFARDSGSEFVFVRHAGRAAPSAVVIVQGGQRFTARRVR